MGVFETWYQSLEMTNIPLITIIMKCTWIAKKLQLKAGSIITKYIAVILPLFNIFGTVLPFSTFLFEKGSHFGNMIRPFPPLIITWTTPYPFKLSKHKYVNYIWRWCVDMYLYRWYIYKAFLNCSSAIPTL